MDEINPQSGRLNQQTSGIPRLSKLPVPRSTRTTATENAVPRTGLRQPQSQASLRQSGIKLPLAGQPKGINSFSRSVNSSNVVRERLDRTDDDIFKKPTSRPSSRDTNLPGDALSDDALIVTDQSTENVQPTKRRPRPSLSERTIETLSQIPPSPASARRKSSFHPIDSPLRPSSRPPSALSTGRPRSALGSRPSSPVKLSNLPSVPRIPAEYNRPQASRSNGEHAPTLRSTASASQLKPAQSSIASQPLTKPGVNVVRPGSCGRRDGPLVQASKQIPRSENPTTTSASKASSNPITRTAAKGGSSSIISTVKPPSRADSAKTSPGAKSSAALRESIAKAKAAAAGRGNKLGKVSGGSGSTFMPEDSDPFGMRSRSPTSNTGLLRKRIQAARMDGQLNIAAMGLKQIPDEVMKMYDFDPTSTSDWAESVDLNKMIAADNEIEEIREDAFPDLSFEELVDSDEDVNAQFAGLEILDLHGNQLRQIPIGLRRLQRLHTLNLSNNNITNVALDAICLIKTLRDLNLASNRLNGSLTNSLGHLTDLQSLNLSGNEIVEIPDTIGSLKQLRKLDVSANGLCSLPIAAIGGLPLTELNVRKNNLTGTLFTSKISLSQLSNLDLSQNMLDKIWAVENVDMPRLQSVRADANRLTDLPNFSGWDELRVLTVSENSLKEFPEGLSTLKSIRTVDLSNNSITRIDPSVAFMEDLSSLGLSGNPLRERKYLTMSAADLKDDLRKKFEMAHDSAEISSSAPMETLTPAQSASAGYQVKAGVLDLSSKGLTDVDLGLVPNDTPIKEIRLTGNKLTQYPTELLASCADHLRALDLSKNPLGKATLSQLINLPMLSSLNLASTGLAALDVLQYLDAPRLSDLDVSINQLQGGFPPLRSQFPQLTSINASDNQFSSLPVSSARGFISLNFQNNELKEVDPKLGLLKDIRMLEVRGNLFRVPRWDLLEKGTGELMKWLQARVPEDQKDIPATGEDDMF